MLTLSSLVTVTRGTSFSWKFDAIVNVEINSSWENLVDTAKVTIPKNIFRTLDSKGQARDSTRRLAAFDGNNSLLRRGDQITIQLGYNNQLTERFTGYITKVGSKIPIEISCEDRMWQLKQMAVKAISVTKISLSDLLTRALPSGTKFECEDISLGKFEIKGSVTVAEFLDYLKKNYGFSIYYRGSTLVVGFAYQTKSIQDFVVNELPVFHFQKNIISSNLEYFRAEDLTYKVKVTNIKPDNSRKAFEFGDPSGEIRTFTFYDMEDAGIEKLATDMLNRYKYTGFRGSFTTFLTPRVKHGDAIRLQDDVIPEQNGVYLVKQVQTRSGVEGGRQEIFLDRVIA